MQKTILLNGKGKGAEMIFGIPFGVPVQEPATEVIQITGKELARLLHCKETTIDDILYAKALVKHKEILEKKGFFAYGYSCKLLEYKISIMHAAKDSKTILIDGCSTVSFDEAFTDAIAQINKG